jgi:hypothetical protein
MRIFKIMPSHPGHDHHHLWLLTAVEEDGSEVTLETYNTMEEAEAARVALESRKLQDPA